MRSKRLREERFDFAVRLGFGWLGPWQYSQALLSHFPRGKNKQGRHSRALCETHHFGGDHMSCRKAVCAYDTIAVLGDCSQTSRSFSQPFRRSCDALDSCLSKSITRSSTDAVIIVCISSIGCWPSAEGHMIDFWAIPLARQVTAEEKWPLANSPACRMTLSVAAEKVGTCKKLARPRIATSGCNMKSSVKKRRMRSGCLNSALAQPRVERKELPSKPTPPVSAMSLWTMTSRSPAKSMSPAFRQPLRWAYLAYLIAVKSSFMIMIRGSATNTAINGM